MTFERVWRVVAALAAVLAIAASAAAGDLANIPPNTWVPIRYTVDQLAGAKADEQGTWGPQGWNRLCYDTERDCHLAMAYNSNPPPGALTNRELYALRVVP